jgi:NADH-quinone oxidoreductase subunit G
MPTLVIDGKEISIKAGASIMEAARMLGISIPHFCYHPKLSVAGNCRMCLVEVAKMPKPVVACAMPVNEGMVVHTNSPKVLTARRGVMEFLLINHPLDCPVCDQGGDCQLQDLAMGWGPDRSRYHEVKRDVPNKDLGPLIETEMDRCIHCTRCVRFSTEIAGVEEMGATFRGDKTTIGPYVEKTLSSELAGNMAEICPVGALNLKPFHFQARPWELKRSPGICAHCAVGCHLTRDHLNGQVKRVMAKRCDPINEAWLCDKGRFSYDGLDQERILTPQIRPQPGDKLIGTDWNAALDKAAERLKSVQPHEVAGLANENTQAGEELFAFQALMRQSVGSPNVDHRLRQRDFSGDQTPLTRADLMMNTAIADLEKADAFLLIGMDTRFETPLIHLRIRKAALAGAPVFSIYPRLLEANFPGMGQRTTPPDQIRTRLQGILDGLQSGTGPDQDIVDALKKAQRPVVMIGDHAIQHPEAGVLNRLAVAILKEAGGLTDQWNGFNRVAMGANSAAAQDMGLVPHRGPGFRWLDKTQIGLNTRDILKGAAEGRIKVLFLLGADPSLEAVDTRLGRQALEKACVIYLGSHQTPAVALADVVLPGVAISEKSATLTNAEGRVQRNTQAVPPPGTSKEDWRILRALSDRFSIPLPFNTREALRSAMADADHRYKVAELAEGELPPACDHSPVTVGLNLNAVIPARTGSGLTLILEPSFHGGDPVTRRSKTLNCLDHGMKIRLNPETAAAQGIGETDRVRLINGNLTIEAQVTLSANVPQGVVFGCHGRPEALLQEITVWDQGFPAVSIVKL